MKTFLEQVPAEKKKIKDKEVDQLSRKNSNGRQVSTYLNKRHNLN